MQGFRFALLALPAVLAACSNVTESHPPRTATEQMLISTAAERAAANLNLPIAKGTRVFLDTSNFEGTDSKYAVGAIRDMLLKNGMRMADDRKTAQAIIEIRSGALSIDKNETLVGTSSFTVPVPFASTGLAIPEIALYKAEEQQGVAKFAATGYAAESGSFMAAEGPDYGFAHKTTKTLLFFISWSSDDYIPEHAEDRATELKASDAGQGQ